MILIADKLKAQGVDLKLWRIRRYAVARTASFRPAPSMSPPLARQTCHHARARIQHLVGIMGIGSSPKYVIGRNGVKLESWDDIKGKKIAIAPGSAVWFSCRDPDREGHPLQLLPGHQHPGRRRQFRCGAGEGRGGCLVTWEPFESILGDEGLRLFRQEPRLQRLQGGGARNWACWRPTRKRSPARKPRAAFSSPPM